MKAEEVYGALHKKFKSLDGDKAAEASRLAQEAAEQAVQIAESMPGDYSDLQRQAEAIDAQLGVVSAQSAQNKADLDNRIKKFYTTNTEDGYLPDSDGGIIRGLEVYGKSEQETTNGYQLLDAAPSTLTGLTVDVIDSCTIRIHGTATANTPLRLTDYVNLVNGQRYCLQVDTDINIIAGTLYFCFYKQDESTPIHSMALYKNYKFTATENDTDIRLGIRVPKDTTLDTVVRFMLESGDTYHEIEKFSGGIPAPNPDYPQPITSVEEINVTVADADGNIVKTTKINPPFQMNAIGSVKDELSVDEGVWKKRFDSVNLGSLSWGKPSSELKSFRAQITNFARQQLNNMPNMLNTNYRNIPTKGSNNAIAEAGDFVATCHNNFNGVFINDSRFDSVNEIKQALDGVNLIYEMAEEQTFPISAADLEFLRNLKTLANGCTVSFTDQNGNDVSSYFLYPVSMRGFVEYAKQQMGDNREFIYDMEDRVVTNEYLSAMAYVNSEYAAALAEIEM